MKKNKLTNSSQGMTLVELLVVIVIFSIVAGLVFYSLSSKRNGQSLFNTEDEVIALLNEAHSRTYSADQNMQYGVHFESGRAVLFVGTAFTDGISTNKEIDFDKSVTLSTISLFGGGSNVVFDKLTGDTSEYGTLTLSGTPSSLQKTVTISRNGFSTGN